MYGLVRLILSAAILLLLLIAIKKIKPEKDSIFKVGAITLSAVMFIVLSAFPVENAFITFKSPESAYRYMYLKDTDIVISGKTTDFVAGKRNGTSTDIFQKTKTGWKLGRKSNIIPISSEIKNNIAVCIWRYRTADDYFISVTPMSTENAELFVKDTLGSETQSINKNGKNIYYMTVHKPDIKYRLSVNGTDFFIDINK